MKSRSVILLIFPTLRDIVSLVIFRKYIVLYFETADAINIYYTYEYKGTTIFSYIFIFFKIIFFRLYILI